jgi:hypothetical protein
MNNELFDSLLRNQLAQQAIQPSAGVKRVVFKKMFFYNLWIFHKVKVFLVLLTVASSSVALVLHKKGQLIDIYGEGFKGALALNQFVHEDLNYFSSTAEHVSRGESGAYLAANIQQEVRFSSQANVEEIMTIVEIQDLSKTAVPSVRKEENKADQEDEVASRITLVDKYQDAYIQDYTSLNRIEVVAEPIEVFSPNFVPDTNFTFLSTYQIKSQPIIFKELSFDGMASMGHTGQINNLMSNPFYNEYYWDFYADQDKMELPRSYGMMANYRIGTYRNKFVLSGGLSTMQLQETHTTYEHNEITNQAWLDYFDVSEISWVNTYGQDTCVNCFYAHGSDELKAELEQGLNKYSYVNIPLLAGYQLNMGRFSMEVKGGFQAAVLTNAKGLYIKRNEHIEGSDLYYWRDLEMSTLSRENELLKPVHVSVLTAATLRVRLSNNFDLLAGYTYFQSVGKITQDEHFLRKDYKGQQLLMGISFYPKRLPLLKNFKQF